MRFKVPQNIDMPDRIVGPLTMIQFIYAVIGGGFCYVIYQSIPAPASYVLILPILLFVICLDFVKINERPFLNFFLSAIEFLNSPKKRIWQQGDGSNLSIEIYKAEKGIANTSEKSISREEIEVYAKNIDEERRRSLIKV